MQSYGQFSYHPSESSRQDNESFLVVLPEEAAYTGDEKEQAVNYLSTNLSKRATEELKTLKKYLDMTAERYQRILNKLSNEGVDLSKTDINDVKGYNKREREIYFLHRNGVFEHDLKIEVEHIKVLRSSNRINPQAIFGADLLANTFDKKSAGVMELGARLNNTRISLPTKFKYTCTKEGDSIKLRRVSEGPVPIL